MVLVRRVEPGDGALLRGIRLAALQDSPSAFASTYDQEVARTDEEWTARAHVGAGGSERAIFFAESDGETVGLVGGLRDHPGAGRVDLVSMWVAPTARRHGVAAALVTAVLEWAVATAATDVALWVTELNAPAQALYESMGFVPTGAKQPLPSDPSIGEFELVVAVTHSPSR